MKKLIYTIGAMMFLSGPLYPWHLQAAEQKAKNSYYDCAITSDSACWINSRVGKALNAVEYTLQGPDGLDWGDNFEDKKQEDIGQDLYLTIYSKTQSNTRSEAIKDTAAQYGMPPERMGLILGGDITPILERTPTISLEEAMRTYNNMRATYDDRKQTADLNAVISAKITPNEIFADGDLENSGFDLINDLNNIEIILFKKNDLVTFGGGLGGNDGSGGGGTDPGQLENPLEGGVDVPVDLNGGVISGGGDDGGDPNSRMVDNPFKSLIEDKSAVLGGAGINPNQCFPLTDIDQVLDQFAEEASTDPRLKNSFVKGATGAGVENGGAGGAGAGGLGGDLDLPVPGGTGASASSEEVTPAPAADYSKPAICDDIVCISLDFIEKPAVPGYSKSDNCIQCHIQFINESLQKTIAHSLIPAKATGNLGESALCKQSAALSLESVGMNVIYAWVPPITPAKEDLTGRFNISKEWDDYAAKNGLWNYSSKAARDEANKKKLAEGKPIDTTPPVSESERMLEIALVNAPDSATQADIMATVSQNSQAELSGQKSEMLVAEIAKDAYAEVDTLQALDNEMKTMNGYFDTFRKQILSLLEDVPGMSSSKACVKLNDKKACS